MSDKPSDNCLLLPQMADIWQQTLNWCPNSAQLTQFQRLYESILEGNRQLNLTRITAPLEFWEKHLWDSLRGVMPLLSNHHLKLGIIDIGTGAGFPGIPTAIAFPNSAITLLDSTQKKITFLQNLLIDLGLGNVTTLTSRAEEIGRKREYRETYDVALIRAVAKAEICAEYALPFLKKDGLAILYRGQWEDSETETLKPSVKKWGGEIESIERFTTPLTQSIRHCLYLRKITTIQSSFPRIVNG